MESSLPVAALPGPQPDQTELRIAIQNISIPGAGSEKLGATITVPCRSGASFATARDGRLYAQAVLRVLACAVFWCVKCLPTPQLLTTTLPRALGLNGRWEGTCRKPQWSSRVASGGRVLSRRATSPTARSGISSCFSQKCHVAIDTGPGLPLPPTPAPAQGREAPEKYIAIVNPKSRTSDRKLYCIRRKLRMFPREEVPGRRLKLVLRVLLACSLPRIRSVAERETFRTIQPESGRTGQCSGTVGISFPLGITGRI